MPVCYEEDNISVYVRQSVYTREEAIARADIKLENYAKLINIEALTMVEMARREIIPAVSAFIEKLCRGVNAKKSVKGSLPCSAETKLIDRLSYLNDAADAAVEKLVADLKAVDKSDVKKSSQAMAHVIIPDMENLRKAVDEMETLTSSEYWKLPTYFDLLYSVR